MPGNQSRRDFFRQLLLSAAMLSLAKTSAAHSTQTGPSPANTDASFEYQYRVFSVERLHEVRTWFEQLQQDRRLSDNTQFQSYIKGFIFNPRSVMVGAKSVIILSIPEKIRSILFHHQGKRYEVLIPCGYTYSGLTGAEIRNRIREEVVRDPGKQVKGRLRLPLKTLAVRSGLAEYGKNNITYVNGYGSFHALYGFYTDQELEESWGPMKMLRLCKGCSICKRQCPTECIRETDFIIDAGRCISLYNELPDPIPQWFSPGMHNSLVGCLKCQFDCPANAEGIKEIDRLAELSEEETEFIIRQGDDKAVHQKIINKLALFPTAQDLPYFSRNLNLVLKDAKSL